MANYSEAHICQCLSRLATARRESVVTIDGDRRKTGIQFVEGVVCLANGLLQLGVVPGDVVSISALNSDLYLEWILAITYIGGIVAPLNYRWGLEEAKSAMDVAKPVLLVTDSSRGFWHSKFSIDSVPSLRWHVLMGMGVKPINTETIFAAELMKEPIGKSVNLNYVWAPERAAVICFTSGTTGRPKGATITHSALVVQSLAKIAIVRYDHNDIYLHTGPLCHIGGISSAMAVLMAGGCHVMMPKFEARLACEAIREHRVTSLITVPTMMADLITINGTQQTSRSLESVTKILNGGGGLSPLLFQDATKIFPRATILSAYGMTEACSSLTFMTLKDPTQDQSHLHKQNDHVKDSKLIAQGGVCVGKPAPHIELKVDAEEPWSPGRIFMRGPHAMLGYWGQSKPVHQGWIDTGDIGQLDDHGNLWLFGREKDKIKTGGENIYPEEVESVISLHPGVSKIVVVGVPDARLTEMVIGCIQLKQGWRWSDRNSGAQVLSGESLRQYCKDKNLTGFKIPKRFVLWGAEFPLTTTGKLRRDQVRAQLISQTQFLSSKL
ncbi:2-succinylbenzoate--CoA ligase, chloroplastic/peroxisomal-like [Henckelia pumila]|uniref:2-succinylbenzoate--CoA ligase, chloroplastic/peroxisomal-like n=1 Tax=Henckelia pumila TaxID=405737 RepID=UPI003C6E6238